MKKTLIILYAMMLFVVLTWTIIGIMLPKRVSIRIAGSTTVYPLSLKWAEIYMQIHPNISVEVTAGGSGYGIDAAARGIIDIGASSHPMTPEQRERYPMLREIPVALDGVAIVLNKKVNKTFKLTLDMAVAIFSGRVRTWEKLEELFNVTIDATGDIHVYVRAEASGTTEMLTLWLSSSSDWPYGYGEVINWPNWFIRVEGNYGIASHVKNDPNGIGYVGLAYVTDEFLVAAVQNPSTGEFVLPTIDTVKRACYNVTDPSESIINRNISGAYPIARMLYYIINIEYIRGKTHVLKFLLWVLTDAQVYVKDVGYADISNTTVQEISLEIILELMK